MTTLNPPYPTTHRQPFPFRVLLAVMVMATIGLGISHAVTKHGEEVYAVRSHCHGQNNWYYNPQSHHFARWCELPGDTHIGIQIVRWCENQWQEVTAYAKNIDRPTAEIAAKSYMKRTGYQELSVEQLAELAMEVWP